MGDRQQATCVTFENEVADCHWVRQTTAQQELQQRERIASSRGPMRGARECGFRRSLTASLGYLKDQVYG